MELQIAKYAINCIKTIEQAGFEAYIVGGAVRDLLLGLQPCDYDIATNASPENIISLFPKVLKTGIKHGTVTVVLSGKPIEVTTYRNDGKYSDSRRPDKVSFIGNIQDDLSRRDFTVNAMAYNQRTGLIDLFGGTKDLKSGILKTVGDPKLRFCEDALRILRLYRFAASYNFKIEESTYIASIENSGLLKNISRERIFSEINLALQSKFPSRIAPLFLSDAFPDADFSQKILFEKLDIIEPNRSSRFAALCYIINKGPEFLKELRADKSLIFDVDRLLKNISNPPPKSKDQAKQMLNLLGYDLLVSLLDLQNKLLDAETRDAKFMLEEIIISKEAYRISDLAVSGSDLLKIGISGPDVGLTLESLLYEVIQNPKLNNKESLIDTAKRIKNQ